MYVRNDPVGVYTFWILSKQIRSRNNGKKTNKPVREKLGFKNIAGTTLFNFTESITAAFMTSWFMVYLTDYAGIGH